MTPAKRKHKMSYQPFLTLTQAWARIKTMLTLALAFLHVYMYFSSEVISM